MASSSTFLKNDFRGFRNTSVQFSKTLGKHIPLNIGEMKEKKDENWSNKQFNLIQIQTPWDLEHDDNVFVI